MVRNKCIDHIRKEPHHNELNTIIANKSNDHQADAQLLSHEFEEKLVPALPQLPDRCRIAFEYSRFEKLTYPEIAKKMGISVKAVEGLMSRSLKILRSKLKDYLPIVILIYRITH